MYQTLQIIVLAYTGLVVLFTIFTGYFQFRYLKSPIEANYRMSLILDKIRGRWTVLLPLKVFSIAFIIAWLALVLPWMDIFLGTHLTTEPHQIFEPWVTWIGTFVGKEGDYYFMTVFVSCLGAKGFLLIKQFTSVLSDTTLEVGRNGGVRYKKRI